MSDTSRTGPDPDDPASYFDPDELEELGLAMPGLAPAAAHIGRLQQALSEPPEPDVTLSRAFSDPRGAFALTEARTTLAGAELALLRVDRDGYRASQNAFSELHRRAVLDAESLGLGRPEAEALCAKALVDACLRLLCAPTPALLQGLSTLVSRECTGLSWGPRIPSAFLAREIALGSLGRVHFREAISRPWAGDKDGFTGFLLLAPEPDPIAELAEQEPAPPSGHPILEHARRCFDFFCAAPGGPAALPELTGRELRILHAMGRAAQLAMGVVTIGRPRSRLGPRRQALMAEIENRMLSREIKAEDGNAARRGRSGAL